MRIVLAVIAGVLALWVGSAIAQTPTPSPEPSASPSVSPTASPSSTSTPESLRYRLLVYGRDPARLAVDGSRLVINASGRAAPCAEGTVVGGRTEVLIQISECPEGSQIGITLFLVGETPITARAEPPLEWRRIRSGEAAVIDAVVRPIPPPTGDGPPSTVRPPDTGDAGLSN